jgi:MFS family permease
VADPIHGWAVDRYGSKPVAVFRFSFLAAVLLLFRLVRPELRDTQIALHSMMLALCGIAMAIIDTLSFVEACVVVEEYQKRNPGLFGENGSFPSLCGITFIAFGLGMTLGPLLAGVMRDT